VSTKKRPAGCDGQARKTEVLKIDYAGYGETSAKSQVEFLIRRFGLPPARAAIVASRAFGEARR